MAASPHPEALFGSDTVSWWLNRQTVLLLGGPRALLLQLAHPSVAAGVDQHSGFPSDQVARLFRTLRSVLTVSFGSPSSSSRVLQNLAGIHSRVHGRQADGKPYDARDPALQWWVLATLIDTALLVERRFLGRLSEEERQRYYVECLRLADAFGIPTSSVPPDLATFAAWMAARVATLEVGRTARRLAQSVVRPRVAVVPGFVPGMVLGPVTVDLLPPALREAYGLTSPAAAALAVQVAQAGVRRALSRAPEATRTFPSWLWRDTPRPRGDAARTPPPATAERREDRVDVG